MMPYKLLLPFILVLGCNNASNNSVNLGKPLVTNSEEWYSDSREFVKEMFDTANHYSFFLYQLKTREIREEILDISNKLFDGQVKRVIESGWYSGYGEINVAIVTSFDKIYYFESLSKDCPRLIFKSKEAAPKTTFELKSNEQEPNEINDIVYIISQVENGDLKTHYVRSTPSP